MHVDMFISFHCQSCMARCDASFMGITPTCATHLGEEYQQHWVTPCSGATATALEENQTDHQIKCLGLRPHCMKPHSASLSNLSLPKANHCCNYSAHCGGRGALAAFTDARHNGGLWVRAWVHGRPMHGVVGTIGSNLGCALRQLGLTLKNEPLNGGFM